MNRLYSIQYLRAVAALAVAVFHVMEATSFPQASLAAGVDIFFVISGFVIGEQLLAPASRAPGFLWRRCIRVLPPYWLATACLIVLAAGEVGFSLRDLGASLLPIPHMNQQAPTAPILEQGWTLYFEMFFYLCATLALFAPPARRGLILGAGLLACVLAGAVWKPDVTAWRAYTSPLLLEFLVGLGLAWLWRRRRTPPGAAWLALGAGVGVLACDLAFGFSAQAPRWLIWGAPAALIVAGLLGLEAAGQLKRWALPALLGDASYAIYLFHTLVFSLVTSAVAKLGLPLGPLETAPLKIAAAALAGVAFHLWIERPMLAWLKHLPHRLLATPRRPAAPSVSRLPAPRPPAHLPEADAAPRPVRRAHR